MEKADFYLDMAPEHKFTGYTAGKSWNGWACPYFKKSEADQIAEMFDGLEHPYDGSKHRAGYDEESDAFFFYEPTSDTEQSYSSVEINGMKLYAIGSYEWTWSRVED